MAECHFVSADAGMRDAAVHAGMLADRFGPVGNHEHKWRKGASADRYPRRDTRNTSDSV